MVKKELLEKLKDVPDDAEIYLTHSYASDAKRVQIILYSETEETDVKNILWGSGEHRATKSSKVLILGS